VYVQAYLRHVCAFIHANKNEIASYIIGVVMFMPTLVCMYIDKGVFVGQSHMAAD
jgi:hypothetical protein